MIDHKKNFRLLFVIRSLSVVNSFVLLNNNSYGTDEAVIEKFDFSSLDRQGKNFDYSRGFVFSSTQILEL